MHASTIVHSAPSANKKTVRTHGKGRLERVGALAVLSVEGTFGEMGEQHGALLATEVARGPIPYYRGMVERLLGKPLGPLAAPVCSAIQRLVGSRIERALPDFAVETIRGIARGAALPEDEFLRGCTMPDSLLWVTARLHGLRNPGPAMAHRLSLGLGCTSAVAWGSATRDGMLYHGRNFDYFGVQNWPDHAAVIFHTPARGQRYVSIGAAGVGLGGVTAMNEAGLSLTVHQHMFTDRTALGGTPIGVVGDVVMREAHDLSQAEEILRRQRPIGCWTYVVTDARAKQVLCFEENPERQVAIRSKKEDTTFGYANIYLDPELGATECNSYGSYWRHNEGRYRRTRTLLEQASGAIDERVIAAILGDPGSDARCRVRDSIAMVMTVGSIVFRPEDGAFWLGVGEAPVSRGAFIPFSLAKGAHAPELGTFSVATPADRRSDEAFEHYRRAYLAYVDGCDAITALDAMEAAAKAAPEQALYHSSAGMLGVEALQPERAVASLTKAIELGHPDEERLGAFHLWRARAHDLGNRRQEAMQDYRVCLGRRADPPVHTAARAGLKSAFTPRKARRMHIEMSLGDVVVP